MRGITLGGAFVSLLFFTLSVIQGDSPTTKNKHETKVTKLTSNRDFLQHLSWSPDGKQFLLTRIHGGKMALWIMQANGTKLRRLLSITQPHFDGHWSPDSKKIVFVYDRLQRTDGKLQINVVNVDGSGHKNLIPHKSFEESPRWSPDGKQILWVSARTKNQEIHVAQADGKKIQQLTSESAPDNNPCWSPDGKQIAF